MDKPITFNEWLGTQGNMVLLHANCCRIAFEGGQQSMQSKVEELQNNINLLNEALDIKEQLNQKLREREDELQKRVDALEKAEFKLAQIKSILQNNPKLLESILVKKIEQALKGEGNGG